MANYATSALKLSDTYVNTLPYNTCSTAAGTAAKTVSAGTFSLETGAMVVVKFTVTNTAANPTLNVSSTGAKAIYYNGVAITAGYLKANKIYQFVYNGTQWDLIGDVDTNTVYTLPAAGTTLGGVKTGGDVTISSGVITVNDDSHNHTIANVDNLQTALDGKATKAEGAIFVEGSGTTDADAKTSTWTGTSDRITEYYDGLAIRYKIGVAGQTTTTLNINGLGAKRVYRFNTTTLTTHFPVGSIVNLIYHADLNSGCWMCNDYDANTDTKVYVYRQTSSYNADYPLLVSRTKAADIATKGSNGSKEAVYAVMWDDTTKVPTLNPSTGEVKATKFTGTFNGTATKATKATQDDSGNVITSTYATKTELTDAIATAITTALNTPV